MPLPRTAKALAVLPFLAASPALADDTPAPPGPVATLDLATRLYAHALAQGDALSAVTAFRLVQSVTLREGADWERSTEDAPKTEAAGAAASGLSAVALLTGQMEAATRDLAAGDEDLLAILDDATAETARGRIGGANQLVASLAPGRQDIWQIPFAGSERAELGVFNDGSGGLGWSVTDAGGAVLCADPWSDQPLYCSFTPRENAFYTVTVVSRYDAEGQYLLATN